MGVRKSAAIAVVLTWTMSLALAEAQDWKYIGPDSNKSEYYIDADSVSRESGLVEFWGKIDGSSDSSVKYREKKTFLKIDCKKKRLGVVYSITYFPDGKSESYGPYDYATLSPIAPDTMGDAMREFICGN